MMPLHILGVRVRRACMQYGSMHIELDGKHTVCIRLAERYSVQDARSTLFTQIL